MCQNDKISPTFERERLLLLRDGKGLATKGKGPTRGKILLALNPIPITRPVVSRKKQVHLPLQVDNIAQSWPNQAVLGSLPLVVEDNAALLVQILASEKVKIINRL